MSDDIQIRLVNVELLRPGPAHNQLLSPLTQYLGICGDAEAGVVTQPFEHATFIDRMEAMRYEDGRAENKRRTALRELGVEVARVLGSIPQLPGALTADTSGPLTLVHLRLVLTPSELAALPFELAKVPVGPNTRTEAWLSLQARSPVVITRRTRNVSTDRISWPLRPRILFVSADPEDVPFPEHLKELLDALQPFMMASRDAPVGSRQGKRTQYGNLLTVLSNASFEEVVAECAAEPYTHVHILAHGVKEPADAQSAYDLELAGTPISAERLASAFSGIHGNAIRRPCVVTLATCDSGNQADSVMVAGGSIAHVLHQAGIPLVVASQVPLSMEGSVLMVREIYRGLLWAEHPWVMMHRLRTALHGLLGASSHDWASLVVYEALPNDLTVELEAARYEQAKAAGTVAFDAIDRAIEAAGQYEAQMAALEESLRRLPTSGRFAMESLGLRASSLKRLAEAEFRLSQRPGCANSVEHVLKSAHFLHQSQHQYERAVNGFLVDDGKPVQRVASLHWVLVQYLCLSAVLGKSVPPGTRETAELSARAYLEHQDPMEVAWAHGSLAELALLALAGDGAPAQTESSGRPTPAEDARGHARELMRLARRLDQPFIIKSTLRQFRRYVEWWGDAHMENVVLSLDLDALGRNGKDRSIPWSQRTSRWSHSGLVGVAQDLADMLDEKSAADRTAKAAQDFNAQAATSPGAAASSYARHPAVAEAASADPGAAAAASAEPTAEPALAGVEPPVAADAAPAPSPAPSPSSSPAPASQLPVLLGHTAAGGVTSHAGAPNDAFLRIEMLPAGHGDCLWLEYGHGSAVSRVLIDGGTPETFEPLIKPRLLQLPLAQRHLELLILTHIDADHIGGGIPLLKAAPELGLSAGDVWFNGWKHIKAYGFMGAKQGEIFSAQLTQLGWPWNAWQDGKAIVLPADGSLPTFTLPGGLVLTLLSPSAAKLKALALKWKKEIDALGLEAGRAEDFLGRTTASTSEDLDALLNAPLAYDAAENNGSSITVLAEFGGKSILLGADCHAPLLAASLKTLLKQRGLKKLPLTAFKVPHHGSRNNLDPAVMGLIDCHRYLISTNGKVFKHPDREALARIIRLGGPNPTLYFNYHSPVNEVWAQPALQAKYQYRTVYPSAGQDGLLVSL